MGKASHGFTLVELMIVISIISILVSLGATNYVQQMKKARDGERKTELEQIRSALEMCRADTGSYPATGSFSFGGTLTCGGNTYMNPVPTDPKNSSPYIYTYSGGGNSYTLCANRLETTEIIYCVNNP
ncbi:MAG: general secretion pathway protein G [Microgenomates group bacterium LiPW_16]|nr:MAG: general secretion pathway protein G [Microgenomates group bacterium LiPW_16]